METNYLADLATAITAEWCDRLADHELLIAYSEAPASGLPIGHRGAALVLLPGDEFEAGEDAILWFGADGAAILWSGALWQDDRPDGDWHYSDAPVASLPACDADDAWSRYGTARERTAPMKGNTT